MGLLWICDEYNFYAQLLQSCILCLLMWLSCFLPGIGYNGFPRGCSDDKLPWAKVYFLIWGSIMNLAVVWVHWISRDRGLLHNLVKYHLPVWKGINIFYLWWRKWYYFANYFSISEICKWRSIRDKISVSNEVLSLIAIFIVFIDAQYRQNSVNLLPLVQNIDNFGFLLVKYFLKLWPLIFF